jgi:hypothetical protein
VFFPHCEIPSFTFTWNNRCNRGFTYISNNLVFSFLETEGKRIFSYPNFNKQHQNLIRS